MGLQAQPEQPTRPRHRDRLQDGHAGPRPYRRRPLRVQDVLECDSPGVPSIALCFLLREKKRMLDDVMTCISIWVAALASLTVYSMAFEKGALCIMLAQFNSK